MPPNLQEYWSMRFIQHCYAFPRSSFLITLQDPTSISVFPDTRSSPVRTFLGVFLSSTKMANAWPHNPLPSQDTSSLVLLTLKLTTVGFFEQNKRIIKLGKFVSYKHKKTSFLWDLGTHKEKSFVLPPFLQYFPSSNSQLFETFYFYSHYACNYMQKSKNRYFFRADNNFLQNITRFI